MLRVLDYSLVVESIANPAEPLTCLRFCESADKSCIENALSACIRYPLSTVSLCILKSCLMALHSRFFADRVLTHEVVRSFCADAMPALSDYVLTPRRRLRVPILQAVEMPMLFLVRSYTMSLL